MASTDAGEAVIKLSVLNMSKDSVRTTKKNPSVSIHPFILFFQFVKKLDIPLYLFVWVFSADYVI